MRIYQECLPQVEIYSVDEVFVHLEGLGRYVDAEHLLQHTRQRIWQELRIPVSMGLGPGKVLAKLANRQGKQAGIALFRWPAEAAGAQRLLMQTPTADVWGIARRLSARMAARAIYTAWDFCQLPERYVQKQWGTPLLRIWHELRGQPMVYEEVAPTQRKSVLVSRSFPTDISTVPELEAAISWFVRCAAQKLMHKQLEARKMAIFLRTNRHKAMDQHRIYQEIALPCPTVYPPLLQRHALQALHASIRPGIAYKKAGVLLWDFCPMGQRQTTLFTPAGTDKQQRLLQAVRHMNSKTDTRIQWASFWQYNQHTDWRGRSEHTTPTTDLSPEEQRQIPIWYALDDDSL
jgi:DNA polymerase V